MRQQLQHGEFQSESQEYRFQIKKSSPTAGEDLNENKIRQKIPVNSGRVQAENLMRLRNLREKPKAAPMPRRGKGPGTP